MGQATHEQANLLLRLYELRRDPKLRDARAWFVANFHAASLEERIERYPPGSEGDTYFRMVVSYWDMAAGLVNRGLIDDEMFFESAGEAFIVWDRLRAVTPIIRAKMKNPHVYENLERLVQRMEAWQEKRAPGHIAVMREMMAQRQRITAKSTSN